MNDAEGEAERDVVWVAEDGTDGSGVTDTDAVTVCVAEADATGPVLPDCDELLDCDWTPDDDGDGDTEALPLCEGDTNAASVADCEAEGDSEDDAEEEKPIDEDCEAEDDSEDEVDAEGE